LWPFGTPDAVEIGVFDVAVKHPSQYEVAQVRLQAFEMLKGWGVELPPDKANKLLPCVRVYNLNERMAHAKYLADWALKL
jgi:hypothetical protein